MLQPRRAQGFEKFEQPGLRHIYREEGGKLVLYKKLRRLRGADYARYRQRGNLEIKNKRLKDSRDCMAVTEVVCRAKVAANFRAELLDATTAHFMTQHRFAVRDGKVLIVGRAGISDVLAAAVQWAGSGEADALLDKSRADDGGGEFMRAVSRMKSLH